MYRIFEDGAMVKESAAALPFVRASACRAAKTAPLATKGGPSTITIRDESDVVRGEYVRHGRKVTATEDGRTFTF